MKSYTTKGPSKYCPLETRKRKEMNKLKGQYKDIFTYEDISAHEGCPCYEITVLENGDTFLQDFGDYINESFAKEVEYFITSKGYLEE